MVKDIKLIESVQRRATKMVQGIQRLNYDERLNYLGLMRLEKTRLRSDLIEIFKFTKDMYDVEKQIFCELDDRGRRGHDQKLFKKGFTLDVIKFSFSNRVVIPYRHNVLIAVQ